MSEHPPHVPFGTSTLLPNPDFCAYERSVTRSPRGSAVHLEGVKRTISFDIHSAGGCDHPIRYFEVVEGFRITSYKHPNTVEIQFYECWEGGILLAENHGGWTRFIEHIRTQSARFMWMKIGRHMSRLAPLRPKERFGIMDTPPNHEVPQDAPQPKYSRFKSFWKGVFPGKESSIPKQGGVRVIRKPRMRHREEETTQTKIIDRSERNEEFASYDEDSKP